MTNFIRTTCSLGFCLAVALAASAAEELRFAPLFRYGTISDGVGLANLIPYDLDGDGKPELISCTLDGSPFAVSARGGTYVTSWHGPGTVCTGVTAGDRNLDGGAEVIVAGGLKLAIYDPRSLGAPVVTVTLPAGPAANDVALGNVDDDPAPEIVVVTGDAAHVYDGVTLELQWTAAGYGGAVVRIGDVDGDARQEIVVGALGGHVLDGAAEVQKWGYVGGFGAFDLGNVDADAKKEIVFQNNSSYSEPISILHGDTFAVTTLPSPWFDSLAVGDANGDGVNEVITGNNQWGDIQGRSATDGALLWHIDNPDHGTMGVGTADLDGNGTREVFWGAGGSSSGPDYLYIGTAASTQYSWRSLDLDGPYHSGTGDLDGDGRLEYVVGTRASQSGDGGVIEIFDVMTGISEGQLTLPQWGYTHAVGIGQLDADAALEVAALIGGVLHTWDGITRLPEFTSNGGGFGEVQSGDNMLIENLDGDPVDEIVIRGGEAVVLLNGASNIIQKSLTVDGYLIDFSVADLNGNSSRELVVATSTGLTVYDTASWSVLGSLATTGIADTAAGGGNVAVSFSSGFSSVRLQMFTGAALTPGYECSTPLAAKLAIGEIGDGETRLLASTHEGIRLFPLAADSCPEPTATFVMNWVNNLTFADATGDGRDDLLIDSYHSATVALLGLSSETRGDVDGDEVISFADIDAVADYLFGAEPGISTSADANADERVSPEDIFLLIDHEFAGGAAPQP
ncbi:MAG TPA: hypothetical protein VE974_17100 [Thermoanaerobaculia bacterium]|nr:hypothetical protein [Thermoanaerobaculia bacterium]